MFPEKISSNEKKSASVGVGQDAPSRPSVTTSCAPSTYALAITTAYTGLVSSSMIDSSDADTDEKAMMTHVLSSETGMPVARLLRLLDQDGDLFVAVRWKELSASEHTLKPLIRVWKDVPKLTRSCSIARALQPPFGVRCTLHSAFGRGECTILLPLPLKRTHWLNFCKHHYCKP